MARAHRFLPILTFAVSILGACHKSTPELHELRRQTSPDGELDLVVSTSPAGATVSTPYEVFVVPKGALPTTRDVVLRIDKAGPPSIAWLKPHLAVVTCDTARIWHFQNFASVRLSGDRFCRHPRLAQSVRDHSSLARGTGRSIQGILRCRRSGTANGNVW